MTIQAQPLIQRAYDVLVDAKGKRWPAAMLVRFLNDGVRETVLHRPDSTSTEIQHPLVAGVKQTLPAGGAKLLGIPGNVGGRAVRLIEDRYLLDGADPNWRRADKATAIKHYLYDVRTPDTFEVYPPAKAGIKVDLIYSAMPPEVPVPSGPTASQVTGEVQGMQDIFSNALLDYVLYRAFQPDAEHAGNEARAQAHYRAFAVALVGELKATVLAAPNRKGTANTVALAAATAST